MALGQIFGAKPRANATGEGFLFATALFYMPPSGGFGRLDGHGSRLIDGDGAEWWRLEPLEVFLAPGLVVVERQPLRRRGTPLFPMQIRPDEFFENARGLDIGDA